MMVDVSIVSPVHNEERCLKEFIQRIVKVMKKTSKSWEIVLINDASTDNSIKIMNELSRNDNRIRYFSHTSCRGQTGCFKTGFAEAKGDVIITMDADLQVLPEDIPRFIEKMGEGYDLVNGIRENRQHPFWMKLASRFYNTLMLLFFNSPVFDAASNFTSVKRKFVTKLKLVDNDHRYLIPIAQRRGAKRIGEVVVNHQVRSHGKSKYKAFPKYLKGFPELFLAWIRIKSGHYN